MAVLMLTRPGQPANTYGRFTAELLKADGLVDLEIASLDQPETLARLEGAGADGIDAVIVTRMLANKAQTAALAGYVRRGGRLIAIRPSRLLSTALGLTPLDTMLCPAYVRPAGAHPVVAGVPQEAIQTHVAADKVEGSRLPPGGVELARLYGDARTPTSFPAVVAFPCGEGEVVLFTYDVAHAVALIRQGDPRLVDGRALGAGHQYRPEDLLVGHADPLCWHLPQADIHGMLLGNAVNHVARAPQPRWWYYPTPETKSVVVLDSDDDWSAPEHFDALIDSVERHGGHITIYLMLGPTKETIATPRKVEAWRARGHSFGIHHNPYDPSFEGEEQDELLEGVVRRDVETFRARYGEVPLTNRNHCVAWKGYVDLPRLYAELGVRMDLNVVSLRSSWLQYLNGSGRPMRFVDLDGTVLECFQQATQAYDDASVKQRLSSDPRGEAGATRRLLEEKVGRSFSPLSMLSHPVSFFTYSSEYMNRVWDDAVSLGLPIWSAFEWAAFTVARDGARIGDGRWEGGSFRCRVEGASPQGALTLMLPTGGRSVLGARVDGEPVAHTLQEAFGWTYALVPVTLDREAPTTREVVLELDPSAQAS
ncbi:MAG TPA: hypothetical protein VH257_15580 [Chloroflexota bacterium]|nr:hypothetical protein [Chloroflexota bacterium]